MQAQSNEALPTMLVSKASWKSGRKGNPGSRQDKQYDWRRSRGLSQQAKK